MATSDAAELNYLDITALGTSQPNKAVTANNDGVVKVALSSKRYKRGSSWFYGEPYTSRGSCLRPILVLVYLLRFQMLVVYRNMPRVAGTMLDTVTDEVGRLKNCRFQVRDEGSLVNKAKYKHTLPILHHHLRMR